MSRRGSVVIGPLTGEDSTKTLMMKIPPDFELCKTHQVIWSPISKPKDS
jgi:hypothetical protein